MIMMMNNNNQQQQKKRATVTATTTITTANEESKEAALLLERKIAIATEGFVDHITTKLRRLQSKQNIETICDYILAMNAEVNPSLVFYSILCR
jgi:hypothetical protein